MPQRSEEAPARSLIGFWGCAVVSTHLQGKGTSALSIQGFSFFVIVCGKALADISLCVSLAFGVTCRRLQVSGGATRLRFWMQQYV